MNDINGRALITYALTSVAIVGATVAVWWFFGRSVTSSLVIGTAAAASYVVVLYLARKYVLQPR